MPSEVRIWLEQQAKQDWVSMNSVIIKCIRSQMAAAEKKAVG
jgi:hypothetical protein